MTGSLPTRQEDSVAAVVSAGARSVLDVLREFNVTVQDGLSTADVSRLRARYGPNAVSSHPARLLPVLRHQVRSPLLGLLFAAVIVSYLVGERSDAVIITVIIAVSVGLGFVSEYRAEKAADACGWATAFRPMSGWSRCQGWSATSRS
jgi:P-type Mg2+ transporter